MPPDLTHVPAWALGRLPRPQVGVTGSERVSPRGPARPGGPGARGGPNEAVKCPGEKLVGEGGRDSERRAGACGGRHSVGCTGDLREAQVASRGPVISLVSRGGGGKCTQTSHRGRGQRRPQRLTAGETTGRPGSRPGGRAEAAHRKGKWGRTGACRGASHPSGQCQRAEGAGL